MDHNEDSEVEQPFIAQLLAQPAQLWRHVQGSKDSITDQGREHWREVLLKPRLLDALQRINLDASGKPWLDDRRLNQAFKDLDRLNAATGHGLMEKNQAATRLLLEGTTVDGLPGWNGGRDQRIHFIDWHTPENNDFLIINQFRIDEPDGQHKKFILPDIVLFVNGIPLVVIECKSPATTNPIEEAINQLLRYSNQRDWVDAREGNEKLFHYAQLLIVSDYDDARLACPCAQFEHYLPWKDCYPTTDTSIFAAQQGKATLSPQQILIEGVLRPERLLDILQNFVIFMQVDGRTVKVAPRYQQYRAVLKAMQRLESKPTRLQDGEFDRRGGIIFHTQGSGKSLTMVFLVRRMRNHVDLRHFKVVFVTDRIDLQDQLSATAELTGDGVNIVERVRELPAVLRKPGPGLVFAMLQKYRSPDEEKNDDEALDGIGELNASESILLIVDEAHRSHAKNLHANLMMALPNAAKLGFTGTPIIIGKKKRTAEIFGDFIDHYTLRDAQADGAILPILYEFRNANGEIKDGKTADEIFEEVFAQKTIAERQAIQKKYASSRALLEGSELIKAKARDVMRHYIEVVLSNHFKAQLTATSRLAVMRYFDALREARAYWLEKIEQLPGSLQNLPDEMLETLDEEQRFLVEAWPLRSLIAKLEFAPVFSAAHNDDPALAEWSDKSKIEQRIARFKKPFSHKDPDKADPLAFLIVKNMLLVGFDAPNEQVLYIDRRLKEDELLQAIARVNRTRSGKNVGYVVDYVGIGGYLAEALSAYAKDDISGAFRSAKQELLDLRDRHARIINLFKEWGIADLDDTEAAAEALRPLDRRGKFVVAYQQFLKTFGNLEHRPEARPYAKDAKTLGFIAARARNKFKDAKLNIAGVGDKVRAIIDEYVISKSIESGIAPVDLLDGKFKKQVKRQKSDRAAAEMMAHAARHYLQQKNKQKPDAYTKLSKHLEAILKKFSQDAKELRKALEEFIKNMERHEEENDTGLNGQTQLPFYMLLVEEYQSAGGDLTEEIKLDLIEMTVEAVEQISRQIVSVNFWNDSHKQSVLRGRLIELLDYSSIFEFEAVEATADRMLELARHLHRRLVAD
ncbi:type I restriction endonuclease subunit R [Methylosarcina fibrata]|uniref:type I restriction endonuclease subunit R n=1 Tax=Methylosarcina fibrata TaxID=105972 RepID=UPI00036A834C|nr:HsdR family type I site-specific deoxyribonuclease [Methylosarcina fibrata]